MEHHHAGTMKPIRALSDSDYNESPAICLSLIMVHDPASEGFYITEAMSRAATSACESRHDVHIDSMIRPAGEW